MDSERLRDYILGRAFKAVRFDTNAHRLAPEYALKAYENEEIEEIACRQYGYSRQEYVNFKSKVLTNLAVSTSDSADLTLPEIGNGDIVEVTGPQDECLRLLKLQRGDFLVLSDDTLDSRPGDVMSMLQYAIRIDAPLLMQIRRGAAPYPARDKAYNVSKVCSLRILHSDASLYSGYLQSASERSVTAETVTKAYAHKFDLGFNGFAGPQLEDRQEGQLYEIDLLTLTYRVNPQFSPSACGLSAEALRQEIACGCCIEEDADSPITRILPVEDGIISLSPREGYYILSCQRQATVSLC